MNSFKSLPIKSKLTAIIMLTSCIALLMGCASQTLTMAPQESFAFMARGAPDLTGHKLRADYLFNFAKYTEWPKEALPGENEPIVFGILGKDPFGKDIDIIKGKMVKHRKLEVKYFSTLAEAKGCHLLFISSSEIDRLTEILQALDKSSVLTVTEVDGSVSRSGMINLVILGKHTLAFDIDQGATERANLKLDTQLLRLARTVKH